MRHLHIDIETYSEASIADRGVYRYAMDPSFKVLLVAFAWDDGPVQLYDLTSYDSWSSDRMVEWVFWLKNLSDPDVIKHAHNATFERVCFSVLLRRLSMLGADEWLDPEQWRCSMVLAARCGLPLSLKQVGEALRLDKQKMEEGKKLIQLFCTPRDTAGGQGQLMPLPARVQPEEFPNEWEIFKRYCIRDVEVEREIEKALSWYEVSDEEQRLYAIDQRINDRGVLVDLGLAKAAETIDGLYKARLAAEAVRLTGLSNPNSPAQLKQWIGGQLGISLDRLRKDDRADLVKLAREKGRTSVLRLLQIRAEMAKTSNAKYGAMLTCAGEDSRARGLLQFYGSRTGRWAGRLIQMQNLPQNHLELQVLDAARRCLKESDYNTLELCLGNVPDTLSQLIRTAFIAPEGKTFAVCDFSAIEARVLAWLAGEEWVLETFRRGGDIYCATASKMFHVPVEKHGQNAHLRQKGKVSVLALGYQGGVGALDQMGGSRLGMTEQEMADTVKMWRTANPSIVAFWGLVERAVKETVVYRTERRVETRYASLSFEMHDDTLTVTLPSGRMLCYKEAQLHFENDWAFTGQTEAQAAAGRNYIGKEKKSRHPEKYIADRDGRIRFKGLDQKTHKWTWLETYGGKLVENITQAVARDCLAYTMALCESAGFPIVFHIHDELVMEVGDKAMLADIQEIFSKGPEWAEGLPLKGAGYTGNYYFKD